jgi:hypothetical protein
MSAFSRRIYTEEELRELLEESDSEFSEDADKAEDSEEESRDEDEPSLSGTRLPSTPDPVTSLPGPSLLSHPSLERTTSTASPSLSERPAK